MTLDQMQAIWTANCQGWNSEWNLSGSSYRTYRNFIAVLKDEKPVSAKWLGWDDWRNGSDYQQRPPSMAGDDGVTYENCVEWRFSLEKRQLTVKVWVGHLYDGAPERERAEWVYEIRDEHTYIIEVIEKMFTEAIWTKAEHQHVKWMEEQLKRRIQKRFDIMMKAA